MWATWLRFFREYIDYLMLCDNMGLVTVLYFRERQL